MRVGARARACACACLLLLLAAAAGAGAEEGGEVAGLRGEVRALQAQLDALLRMRADDLRLLEEKGLELQALRGDVDRLRERQQQHEKSPAEAEAGAGAETTRQHNARAAVAWAAGAVAELRAAQAEAAAAAARNASQAQQRAHAQDAALTLLRTDVDALREEQSQLRAQAQRGAVEAQQLRADAAEAQRLAHKAAATCADLHNQVQTAVDDWETSVRALRSRLAHQLHQQHQLHQRHHKMVTKRQHPRLRHAAAAAAADAEVSANEVGPPPEPRLGPGLGPGLERRVSALEAGARTRGAALDKLHLSALQLLEGLQALEAKVDKALPELQAEVAGAEGAEQRNAQRLQVLQEEQENERRSERALAGGQEALQQRLDAAEERERQRLHGHAAEDATAQQPLPRRVAALERALAALQAGPASAAEAAVDKGLLNASANASASASEGGGVGSLVRQLARVQSDYEAVVSRLPEECSALEAEGSSGSGGGGGLFLIAPGGRAPPLVTRCLTPSEGDGGRDGDEGAWTLVQRRVDGALDFNRRLSHYEDGFGSPAGEFWLGLRALHRLTAANCSELRVDLRDIYGRHWAARYSSFRVGPSGDGFRLRVAGYSGNASDALDYQNHMQFSAADADRDISNTHCAANYEGGWWFSHCQHANLNGRYSLGLTWFDAARNEWIAVARSELWVRRRRDCAPSDGHSQAQAQAQAQAQTQASPRAQAT